MVRQKRKRRRPVHPDLRIAVRSGPFAGLNVAKARAINDALIGHRVLVGGGKFDLKEKMVEYLFTRMLIPGDRTRFMDSPFSLVLTHVGTDREVSPGITRHVCPTLLWAFIVIEAPELWPCWRCGQWKTTDELHDPWDEYSYGPEPIRYQGYECRKDCPAW